MAWLRPRFWHKVLGALLIVGVVPIALVSAVSIQSTRNDLTALGVTNIQQRSTSTASAIDAYLQSRLGDIVLVGKLPDIVRFGQNLDDPGAKLAAREALVAAASFASGSPRFCPKRTMSGSLPTRTMSPRRLCR